LLLDNEVDNDSDYDAFDQSTLTLIQNTPIAGEAFKTDNYDLFQLLITWTSGGTAETYVDRYRRTSDGRAAWTWLLQAMEGRDARNARIQAADDIIDTSFWDRIETILSLQIIVIVIYELIWN
jgi:hypothetical protein